MNSNRGIFVIHHHPSCDPTPSHPHRSRDLHHLTKPSRFTPEPPRAVGISPRSAAQLRRQQSRLDLHHLHRAVVIHPRTTARSRDFTQICHPAPPRAKPSLHRLEGRIPAGLNGLSKLRRLELQSNNLLGDFPDLSSLKTLSYLDASDNAISGELSQKFPTSLVQISLRNNTLVGNIPANAISTLPYLQVLDGGCGFCGSLVVAHGSGVVDHRN